MKDDPALPSPPPYKSKTGGTSSASVASDFEEEGDAAETTTESSDADDTRKEWVQEIYKGVFVTLGMTYSPFTPQDPGTRMWVNTFFFLFLVSLCDIERQEEVRS